MQLLLAIPILILAILIIVFIVFKKKRPSEKLKYRLLVFALICGILSMIAVISSAYYSDYTQLYKLALPAMISIMAIVQIRQIKKRNRVEQL